MSVGHEHIHAIGVAGSTGAVDAGQKLSGLSLGAVGNAGEIGNVLARQVKDDRPVIDADNAIGSALKVGCDMAREQNAVLPVGDKGEQLVE